jgi:glutaredoxin
MASARDVILYTRNECGLCYETQQELRSLCRELSFTLTEIDIDADAALRDLYNDVVPVVAVGERIVAHAPIAPGELREALAAALG